MEDMRRNTGTNPPEETIEELEQEQKKSVRALFFVLAALIAVIALGIAWFLNNSRVSVGVGVVSTSDAGFELASIGGAGTDDDYLKDSSLVGSEWSYINADQSVVSTSEKAGYVNLQLTRDSNVKNYGSMSGLQPNTAGQLVFYVIPNDPEVTLTLTFSLDMIPYVKTESTQLNTGLTKADQQAAALLNGHILLFEEKSSSGYSKWISEGSFTRTFDKDYQDQATLTVDGEKKTAYKVTLYWTWPYVIGQTLLPAGDDRLGGRSVVFADAQEKQEAIEAMHSASKNYFCSYTPNQEMLNKIAAGSNSGTFDTSAFNTVSSYYNDADQYIGDHMDYVVIQLKATG